MSARLFSSRSFQSVAPRGARFASNLPIPPKVATPNMVSSGGSSKRMDTVVDFYKSLPKGESTHKTGGIKGAFFAGKNASGKPIVAWIGAMILLGYTISYQTHLKHHKNSDH
ncbi:hydrogen-transporting ATP synthase [Ceraceosorus guamensis]|uniref:Hydrogen-transporting ATP synthase n=1 Tax=Ceraceosorus guamensis TaxID=1522189 RepID=A0A316W913_9BASI|nr:hydrogen-transporting ATP synthase [Ceraceosorus guamensis]PWN46406.1 hydrogen-transporting ATP synthase [Ceraceosorus guamensis]